MTTRTRLTEGDGDERHGTLNGYSNLRCRCEECRRAWATYCLGLRGSRVPPPPGDEAHGNPSTYWNRNCRCRLCTDAKTSYQRDFRRRSNSDSAVAS